MSGNTILLLPVILPFIAGIIIGFIKNEKQRNMMVFITLAVELALVVYFMMTGGDLTVWHMTQRLTIAYHIDGIAKYFACIISIIWLLAAIFSMEYIKHEHKQARFFMFYVMSLGTLISLCFSANMITMYLSYEFMTLLTFPLVIHSQEVQAVRAGMKYLGYSIFGAGLGLLGFFFLNTYCVTTTFAPGGTLDFVLARGNENLLLLVFFLMVVGFGCKAGMFPLHAWLPTAHPVAPAPASAVLSGIITKGGVICIIRVTFYLFGADFIRGSWAQTTLLILTLITIFMGSMLAYKENLLKKRLAYSTVSQVSYVLFGLMLLTPVGFAGALLQVAFHAVGKNILFLSAGAMIYKKGTTFVNQLRGVGKEMPIVMWCFAIAALSLVGIPPTGGFVSKWFLAQGALSSSLGALAIVGVAVLMVSALLTAGYLLSIVIDGFFPGKDFDYEALEKKEPNYLMTMPLVILTISVVLLGIFPVYLETFINSISGVIF
ncbi:complex I subunit 5 family protein [Anaerotignum sp.]|uniref:complex I subunit 5 family protein n=1 Tax=Anaerotignum sp. TaxID=2039241 RepID=UPI0027151FE7|nr:proton-conducting transporter membrane subunit [Anaerotignum sp.]